MIWLNLIFISLAFQTATRLYVKIIIVVILGIVLVKRIKKHCITWLTSINKLSPLIHFYAYIYILVDVCINSSKSVHNYYLQFLQHISRFQDGMVLHVVSGATSLCLKLPTWASVGNSYICTWFLTDFYRILICKGYNAVCQGIKIGVERSNCCLFLITYKVSVCILHAFSFTK